MVFDFLPLTNNNWNDFVALFGNKKVCGGCWCMTWGLKTILAHWMQNGLGLLPGQYEIALRGWN